MRRAGFVASWVPVEWIAASGVIFMSNSLRSHIFDATETEMADRADRKVDRYRVEIAATAKFDNIPLGFWGTSLHRYLVAGLTAASPGCISLVITCLQIHIVQITVQAAIGAAKPIFICHSSAEFDLQSALARGPL